MRPLHLLCVWVGALALTPPGASAQEPTRYTEHSPASRPGWKLIFADEFDKPGSPDPANWGYELGFVRNNEAQFYARNRLENARVEGGNLVIEARKETLTPDQTGGSKAGWRGRESAGYTSASLTTQGKHAWTYGRIEVRAKLPSGRGTWPAIWMLGTNIDKVGWPACGEIDIMEYVGFLPDTVHANVHMTRYNHTRGTGKGDKIQVKDAADAFHRYALEWFSDRMDFYVDDKKYFTFRNENPPGQKNVETWPFNQPQYLILNLAIGGAWGGQKGIDDSIFPVRYLIDYVRVY